MRAGVLVRDSARTVVPPHIVPLVATKTRDEITFGAYFDRLMLQTFANREQLARVSGVDATTIGRWIRGEKEPTLPALRAVAPHLGVRLADLMVKAGLATREELGTVGSPAPPGPPLTRAERTIRSRLMDPRHTERYRRAFHAALLRAIDGFDEVFEALQEAPPDVVPMRRR